MMRSAHRTAPEGARSSRGPVPVEISMNACASPPLQPDCTRLLLVDTDDLFLADVGGALRANEGLVVVATARSIEDAYDCAARNTPDVIVIGWGAASRAFVHATLAGRSAGVPDPLVVIVLRRGNHQRSGADLAQPAAERRTGGA